jgi:hypothetical protein
MSPLAWALAWGSSTLKGFDMKFYVTMTDKYLSGWGVSEGKTNKLIIECETIEQAEQIERAARRRSEMRYVNIRTTKPRYGSNVVESWKTWGDLGEVWTGVKA